MSVAQGNPGEQGNRGPTVSMSEFFSHTKDSTRFPVSAAVETTAKSFRGPKKKKKKEKKCCMNREREGAGPGASVCCCFNFHNNNNNAINK